MPGAAMSDVPEPEDLYDDFEPEGQESEAPDFAFEDELNAALRKGVNGKRHADKSAEVPDLPPRAASEAGRAADDELGEDALASDDPDSGGLEDSELEDILASLFEEPPHRRSPARPPQTIAQQAASLVARQSSAASTGAVFKTGAARAASRPTHSPEEMYASAAQLENAWLVQTLTVAASRAAQEKEAGLLAAAAVPLLMQDFPAVYRGLWPALPALSAGVDGLARFLFRSETLRPLVTELPVLLRSVIHRLARDLSSGRPVTSRMASDTLAKYAKAWLEVRTGDPTTQLQPRSRPRPARPARSQDEE